MTEMHSQQDHQVQEKRMQDHLNYEMSLLIALVIGAHPNSCFENVLNAFTIASSRLFKLAPPKKRIRRCAKR
ncbi:MAG TPA: hypothetical protein VFB60_26785 [Ktedonobacteraceae bacterium]|nr:hypothetical protein [Ktedonobacteraceae bacterium]